MAKRRHGSIQVPFLVWGRCGWVWQIVQVALGIVQPLPCDGDPVTTVRDSARPTCSFSGSDPWHPPGPQAACEALSFSRFGSGCRHSGKAGYSTVPSAARDTDSCPGLVCCMTWCWAGSPMLCCVTGLSISPPASTYTVSTIPWGRISGFQS